MAARHDPHSTNGLRPLDLYAFPPIAATLDAAYSLLMWLATLLEPLAGPAAAAASVVLLTLLVRAVLVPAGIAQAKAEQTRSRLAPRLRELQRRHRRDPERLQRETMKLYADENTSPLAGCLPMLAQAPVVAIVYALFLHTTIAGHTNVLLAEQLFGVPLGASLLGTIAAGTATASTAGVFAAVVAVIAVVAEITRRAFRPPVDDSRMPHHSPARAWHGWPARCSSRQRCSPCSYRSPPRSTSRRPSRGRWCSASCCGGSIPLDHVRPRHPLVRPGRCRARTLAPTAPSSATRCDDHNRMPCGAPARQHICTLHRVRSAQFDEPCEECPLTAPRGSR